MLIILPTYKRLDTVYWVLHSIMRCTIPNLADKPRIAIINNYPPYKNQIEEIIIKIRNSFPSNDKWDWIQLNRKNTLPPVENWFSALEELANKDEVVFFVGDDDPLPSDSLLVRYNAITNMDADFVLGRLNSGLYFTGKSKIYFIGQKEKIIEHPKIIELQSSDIWNWSAIHLSNHCFIYNLTYKKALTLAKSWCDTQSFADKSNRELFITYYLVLAINKVGGKIISIEKNVLLRGTSVDEIRDSKYGIRSWNLGFISLLAYDVLNTNFSKDVSLESTKEHFLEMFKKWYLTYYFDKRLVKKELKNIINNIIGRVNLRPRHYLSGLTLVLKDVFNLTALPLKIKSKIYSIDAETFFNNTIK